MYFNCIGEEIMNIAERLKKTRLELGLTQQALASKAGITQQAINSIENGHVDKSKYIVEIAKALGCSAEWLNDGK